MFRLTSKRVKKSKKSGALGALDSEVKSHLNFELGSENPNEKTNDEMIKSVCIKDSGNRWYVEYREFIEEENKWHRRREYGGVNKIKDLDRKKLAIQSLYHEVLTSVVTRFSALDKGESEIDGLIISYLAHVKTTLSKSSHKNYKLSLKYFYSHLKARKLNSLPLHLVTKAHVHELKISLSKKLSNRSVKDHISNLSIFLNYYKDNYDNIIFKNPCDTISDLPTQSESHVTYTDAQQDVFFKHMGETDPWLLVFCMFIGFAFTRCKETLSIRVRDFDMKRRTTTLWAGYSKNRTRENKPMLDGFYNLLMSIEIYKYPPDYYVFSSSGGPGPKPCGPNYFGRRFRILKKEYNLGKEYSMYGWRHTSVCQMLENGAEWTEIMKYTGHKTMEAFQAYANALLKKPAKDLTLFLNSDTKKLASQVLSGLRTKDLKAV